MLRLDGSHAHTWPQCLKTHILHQPVDFSIVSQGGLLSKPLRIAFPSSADVSLQRLFLIQKLFAGVDTNLGRFGKSRKGKVSLQSRLEIRLIQHPSVFL